MSLLSRADIVKDTYLRLTVSRFGNPAGLIGVVHTIGTNWSGNWYFQLRWLNPPAGTRNKPVSSWSPNLREADLEHFERIETWERVQELLEESRPPSKPSKKGIRIPTYLSPLGRVPRGKRHGCTHPTIDQTSEIGLCTGE